MKKKLLSILLCLCMVMTLLPTMALGAATTRLVFTDATPSVQGDGYSWNGATQTLTLYGVDIEVAGGNAVKLPDGATVELVGYNKLTNASIAYREAALRCDGDLTIGGSGILETVTGRHSIYSDGALTVKNGYIKANQTIDAESMTVKGGYLDINSNYNDSNGIAIYGGTYEQSAGYVRATATGINSYGLSASNVTVSGGYLEASGIYGIYANGGVTNDGGVIKTTGTDGYGIGGAITANSGVTIAEGSVGAVTAAITLNNNEEVWERTGNSDTYDVNTYQLVTLNNNRTDKTSIAVAKGAYATVDAYGVAQPNSTILDSVYINYSEDDALSFTEDTTITGGSYVKNNYLGSSGSTGCVISEYNATGNVTISGTGTLVSEGSAHAIYAYANSTYSGSGTLACIGTPSQAMYGALNISNGHVIGVAGNHSGNGVNCATISGGSVIGVCGSTYGQTGVSCNGAISNASVTGVTASTGDFGNGVDCASIANSKVSGYSSTARPGVSTDTYYSTNFISATSVVGAYSVGGNAITCNQITDAGLSVQGAAGLSGTFSDATYDANTYKIGGNPAKVVYIAVTQAAAPTATTTAINKTGATQAAVSFTLTNSPAYAGSQTWKVYAAATGSTLADGVTAANTGNVLTLNHATDVPEATYYVSVTETGKAESDRLALTVGAYAPATYTATLDPSGHTFPAQMAGYSSVEPQTFTITNTSTADLTALNVAFTTPSSSFELDTDNVAETVYGTTRALTVVGSVYDRATFTVKPVSGLAAGSYSAQIQAGATELITPITAEISFTVNPVAAATYTVTYNANGGNVTPATALTGADGKLASLPIPTRSGSYTFNGWYTATSGGNRITADNVFSAGTTIYAQWTYTGGGSSGGSGSSDSTTTLPLKTTIASQEYLRMQELQDLSNAGQSLTVNGVNGAKLVFDSTALKSITTQSSDSVKVVINDVSGQYRNQFPSRTIFSLTVTAGGKTITNFGGQVTISLPYELKKGEDPEDVTVWYLDNDGNMTEIPCAYDPKTKLATFTVSHFSHYMVGVAPGAADEILEVPAASEVVSPVKNPFKDVASKDWFHDAVLYVYEKGLMRGTASDTFSPYLSTDRGMIVTILWLMENEPNAATIPSFKDVKANQYYYKAVAWTAEKGIVQGYGADTFAPEDTITREQLATILYNYASWKGLNPKASSDLTRFNDANQISAWAKIPMNWANGAGLINGVGGGHLDPTGQAQRCQTASILKSFME